jgi:hypothetical protein
VAPKHSGSRKQSWILGANTFEYEVEVEYEIEKTVHYGMSAKRERPRRNEATPDSTVFLVPNAPSLHYPITPVPFLAG